MTWLHSLFARPDAVPQLTAASITRDHAKAADELRPDAVPQLTAASITRDHAKAADELRAEGAAAERARIAAVYEAASWVTLEPLVERLMFDGRTPPEAAALAKIAAAQAGVLILAEAVRRRDETTAVLQ